MTSFRETTIQRLEAIIGYQFQDKSWAWEAVQIAGSGEYHIGGRSVSKGNQRLAVCGDAFVASLLAYPWYSSGTEKVVWTEEYRNSLLGNNNLNRIGREVGLDKLLVSNPNNRVLPSDGLVATLVEAVFGAVKMDGGDAALRTVIRKINLVPEDMVLVKFNISFPIH